MRRYQFTCHLFLRRRIAWKTLRGILRPFKKIFEITYWKLQRFDGSHIVTNRSGDILILITISMGKEKSQLSKILIESIHRWNRSRISIRAVYLTMSGTLVCGAQISTQSSKPGVRLISPSLLEVRINVRTEIAKLKPRLPGCPVIRFMVEKENCLGQQHRRRLPP